MAEIKAFKGMRYNVSKGGDLNSLVCPPYDIISDEQRTGYIEKNPYNIIRLELPKGDDSRYKEAGDTLDSWLSDGVLAQDEKDSIYVYEMEFTANGKKNKLKGFVSLVKLVEFSEGIVLPHEETLSKAKVDRFNLMDSTLNVESEYGKGSTFSFDLVQKITDSSPLGDFLIKYEKDIPASANENFIAPDARILVVDDNNMNLKVFTNLLKKTQIQISEAKSGIQCIDMVKNNSFDIIFLDHMMPGMDGIETLHRLREDKLCEGVPVIMLTANAIVGDREKYISEGFDDFLSKPIDPEKLDKMVLYYLNQKQKNIITESVKKNTAPKTAGEIIQLLAEKLPEINTVKGLEACVNDEEFYIELLTDYTSLNIKAELDEMLKLNDSQNYCIKIHSFKSSSYSIGAMHIGDLAYRMEKISRECLNEEIIKMQNELFRQYDRICTKFNDIKSDGDV